MEYIKFLKELQRDQASLDRIKDALNNDVDALYLDTTRICAKWLFAELMDADYAVLSHSFSHKGNWEQLLVNTILLNENSLQDLEKAVSPSIDEWNSIDSPNNHLSPFSL